MIRVISFKGAVTFGKAVGWLPCRFSSKSSVTNDSPSQFARLQGHNGRSRLGASGKKLNRKHAKYNNSCRYNVCRKPCQIMNYELRQTASSNSGNLNLNTIIIASLTSPSHAPSPVRAHDSVVSSQPKTPYLE